MKKNLRLRLIAFTLLASSVLVAAAARAQNDPKTALTGQLQEQYKIMETVLIVQKVGIVGVSRDAIPQLPRAGKTIFLIKGAALFGPDTQHQAFLGTDIRTFSSGDKVYVTSVNLNFKEDKVEMGLEECAKCNGIDEDAAHFAFVVFQFPSGYLSGGADIGQVTDGISQLLAMENVSSDAPQPPLGNTPQTTQQQSPATILTNEGVLKLVKAHMPDSVIIATITASNCQFDKSPDALIAMQNDGASSAVLKAVAEAPVVGNLPPSPPEPGLAPVCGDYASCISMAKDALASSAWNDAEAAFRVASTLDPKRPDAWIGLGNVYLATNRMHQAPAVWDKALNAGGSLIFRYCHQQGAGGCWKGDLAFGPEQVSFTDIRGKSEFEVPPSGITSADVADRRIYRAVQLKLVVSGKNFNFYFVPFGSLCKTEDAVNCSPEGIEQQRAVTQYISQAIPKLTSGQLGPRAASTKP